MELEFFGRPFSKKAYAPDGIRTHNQRLSKAAALPLSYRSVLKLTSSLRYPSPVDKRQYTCEDLQSNKRAKQLLQQTKHKGSK